MRIYNTYSKKLEPFTFNDNTIHMYNCGPTVYDYAHIGNFRSFLFADVLRRYLEYKGYEVKQVMNFTDVGHMTQDDLNPGEQQGKNMDKMALAAQKTGIKDPIALADRFIDAFLEDSKVLHCKDPLQRPRASEHITEMIELIKQLIDKGHAYEVDGFVYFDESSFPQYGKLSGNTPEELVAGHRVEVDPRKKHPADFALWKCDAGHIMKWDSPWGEGFPGWHIECSAMAMKYLGETLDIHTGGEDNIFPHHEAEIAQSQGATDKTFARYWIHARHLMVDGGKMSKSLGNFFTVRDLMEKGYNGEEIRYALISTHYRQNMNFTTGIKDGTREKYGKLKKIEALEEARAAIRRLADFNGAMSRVEKSRRSLKKFANIVEKAEQDFIAAMDDDLNISGALAAVFQFIKESNKMRDAEQLSKKDAQRAVETLRKFDEVLAVLPPQTDIPAEIMELVAKREQARKDKDYALADQFRKQLKGMGYVVEDTSAGSVCKKI